MTPSQYTEKLAEASPAPRPSDKIPLANWEEVSPGHWCVRRPGWFLAVLVRTSKSQVGNGAWVWVSLKSKPCRRCAGSCDDFEQAKQECLQAYAKMKADPTYQTDQTESAADKIPAPPKWKWMRMSTRDSHGRVTWQTQEIDGWRLQVTSEILDPNSWAFWIIGPRTLECHSSGDIDQAKKEAERAVQRRMRAANRLGEAASDKIPAPSLQNAKWKEKRVHPHVEPPILTYSLKFKHYVAEISPTLGGFWEWKVRDTRNYYDVWREYADSLEIAKERCIDTIFRRLLRESAPSDKIPKWGWKLSEPPPAFKGREEYQARGPRGSVLFVRKASSGSGWSWWVFHDTRDTGSWATSKEASWATSKEAAMRAAERECETMISQVKSTCESDALTQEIQRVTAQGDLWYWKVMNGDLQVAAGSCSSKVEALRRIAYTRRMRTEGAADKLPKSDWHASDYPDGIQYETHCRSVMYDRRPTEVKLVCRRDRDALDGWCWWVVDCAHCGTIYDAAGQLAFGDYYTTMSDAKRAAEQKFAEIFPNYNKQ